MGFKTRGISQKTRFKRHPSASGRPSSSGLTKLPLDMDQKRMKWTPITSLSPTAAPFNSTSFLIWQRSQQRENEEAPGVCNQYGSNVGNMITCCPFTHNRDYYHYQSQAQHPTIVKGMSNPDSLADDSLLHLQFQGLHVTDSDSDMEVDTACDPGDSALKHRRVRSSTDDNFEMFDYSNVQYDILERELLEDPKAVCDYKIF